MLLTIIILFIAVVAAFWISAIAGGGASLIILPLLSTQLPVSLVPFTLTLGTFTSSVSRIFVFKKNIYWPLFFWFVPFSLPAVFMGVYCLRFINPVYLQFFIALFMLLNVFKLFGKKKGKTIEKKQSVLSIAFTGFFAGFVSGFTGAVGLLFNRFYLRLGLTKEQIVATRAANEIFIHLIKLALYMAMGLYSGKSFVLGLVIAAASIVSALTLKYILPFVSDKAFQRTGHTAMVVSGAFLMSASMSEIVKSNNVEFIAEAKNNKSEWGIAWNNKHFVMEHSGTAVEFEHSVSYDDLPAALQHEYNKFMQVYSDIKLERVYKIGGKVHYEFYTYKEGKRSKYKFNTL